MYIWQQKDCNNFFSMGFRTARLVLTYESIQLRSIALQAELSFKIYRKKSVATFLLASVHKVRVYLQSS